MRPSLFLWLAACGGADDGAKSEGPSTPAETLPLEPAPYVVDAEGTEVPDVDLAEVSSVLQGALDQLLSIHAQPVRAAYDEVMAGQDARCPYYYTTADGSYWYDSCESENGSAFNGYIFAFGSEDGVDPVYGFPVDSWSAFGAATVVDPEGRVMEMGGTAVVSTLYGDGYTTFTSVVQGTFVWDGAVDGWLTTDLSPDLTLYGYAVDGLADKFMYIDGGVSGLDGGWAVAFADNQIAGVAMGVSPCGEELSGTVGVRSPEGVWVDVVFQQTAAGCDGCGEAYVQGQSVGEVCVDATVLTDWAVSPW